MAFRLNGELINHRDNLPYEQQAKYLPVTMGPIIQWMNGQTYVKVQASL
jgi:hypothetical protein